MVHPRAHCALPRAARWGSRRRRRARCAQEQPSCPVRDAHSAISQSDLKCESAPRDLQMRNGSTRYSNGSSAYALLEVLPEVRAYMRTCAHIALARLRWCLLFLETTKSTTDVPIDFFARAFRPSVSTCAGV